MIIEKQIYAVCLFQLLSGQIVSNTKSLPSWIKKLKNSESFITNDTS